MPSRDLTLKRSINYSVMLAIGRRDKNFSKMFITMRERDISEERSFCNTLTKDILNLGGSAFVRDTLAVLSRSCILKVFLSER